MSEKTHRRKGKRANTTSFLYQEVEEGIFHFFGTSRFAFVNKGNSQFTIVASRMTVKNSQV